MTDMPSNDAPSDKVLAGTATTDGYQAEYQVIQGQRREFIRQYNVWFSIGQIMAHGTFWLMLNISLSIGSAPVMAGSAIAGTVIVFFSYRMVLEMDRSVVSLYPRIIFLELQLGFDFYRDYLRRRPRGDTERSFIDKCEQMQVVLD